MQTRLVGITVWAFVSSTLAHGADTHRGGFLVFGSGGKLAFEDMETFDGAKDPADWVLRVSHAGIVSEVRLADIEAMYLMEVVKRVERDFTRNIEYIGPGSVLSLQTPQSPETTTTLVSQLSFAVTIRYIDPLSKKVVTSRFNWGMGDNEVKGVVFDANGGDLRYSAQSRTYFPPSYNFNPYTGEKLVWRHAGPEGRREPHELGLLGCVSCNWVGEGRPGRCPQCGRPTQVGVRTDPRSKGVEYFLQKLGVDDSSDAGRFARKWAVKYVDPFSTEEEIESALKDLVDNLRR